MRFNNVCIHLHSNILKTFYIFLVFVFFQPILSFAKKPIPSEINIALDFDRTLVTEAQGPHGTIKPYPKVGEFIAGLLALKPHPKLYIYTDTPEHVVSEMLPKITLPDGTRLDQYVQKIIKKDSYGKDLTKISSDIKNTILIDNDFKSVFKGQEKHLLTFPDPHFYVQHEGPNYDYVIGILREALKNPKDWTQKLYNLQWYEGKFNSLKYGYDDPSDFPEFKKIIESGSRYLKHVSHLFQKRMPFFSCVLKNAE